MEIFKQYLTGLFVLIVAFSYSIYFIIQTGFGIAAESLFFQAYSGLLAIIVFIIYAISFNKIPNRANMYSLFICGFVLILYYMTQLFYEYNHPRYQSYLLSTGVRFIPAILMGVVMLKDGTILQKIERALFPFALLYTIVLVQVVFTAKVDVNIASTFNNAKGMSYQSISYYSIFAFGITMYLITYGNYNKLKRYIVIYMAILQFLMTIMSGGRGAFILGVVFCAYFGMKTGSLRKLVPYGLGLICAILLIQSFGSGNEVFMQGFNRIFNFFGENDAMRSDARWIRWGMAFDAFQTSPILGHGLGSVFYEVGFYSHNIFTDMLCEGGIILTGLFVLCLLKFYQKVKQLAKIDSRHEIIAIIFICSFVMSCFSGYYLSDSGMWLALSYILNKQPDVLFEN